MLDGVSLLKACYVFNLGNFWDQCCSWLSKSCLLSDLAAGSALALVVPGVGTPGCCFSLDFQSLSQSNTWPWWVTCLAASLVLLQLLPPILVHHTIFGWWQTGRAGVAAAFLAGKVWAGTLLGPRVCVCVQQPRWHSCCCYPCSSLPQPWPASRQAGQRLQEQSLAGCLTAQFVIWLTVCSGFLCKTWALPRYLKPSPWTFQDTLNPLAWS